MVVVVDGAVAVDLVVLVVADVVGVGHVLVVENACIVNHGVVLFGPHM